MRWGGSRVGISSPSTRPRRDPASGVQVIKGPERVSCRRRKAGPEVGARGNWGPLQAFFVAVVFGSVSFVDLFWFFVVVRVMGLIPYKF